MAQQLVLPPYGQPPATSELESWIHQLKHGGKFPHFDDFRRCPHGWASPPGDTFPVRGPDYMKSKKKVPAGEWLLQPLAFDLLKSSSKITSIMRHPNSRVRAALDAITGRYDSNPSQQKPFLWVFHFQTGSEDNHSLIMYYLSLHSPAEGSLMQRFLDGDDTFRNARLKVLTGIPQGPWIVKAAVGERGAGALVGKLNTCTYMNGSNYIEVAIDSASSRISKYLVRVALAATTVLTVDLAFLIEGTTPGELPERILGAIRFSNLDASGATSIDPLLSPSRPIKEKPNIQRSVWESFSKLVQFADRSKEEKSSSS